MSGLSVNIAARVKQAAANGTIFASSVLTTCVVTFLTELSMQAVESVIVRKQNSIGSLRQRPRDRSPCATAHNFRRPTVVARKRLTPLQETEARRIATAEAKKNKKTVVRSDAEKAAYRERIGKAKDALTRSVGTKGEHVTIARAALKEYLRRLDETKQPDDARFDALIEAPFKDPPKKKTNDRY